MAGDGGRWGGGGGGEGGRRGEEKGESTRNIKPDKLIFRSKSVLVVINPRKQGIVCDLIITLGQLH